MRAPEKVTAAAFSGKMLREVKKKRREEQRQEKD